MLHTAVELVSPFVPQFNMPHSSWASTCALAETRKELSEMKSEMMALLQRVVEKVDA